MTARQIDPCRFSADGAHDFTDSYAPDGHPEFLYCRRCGEVILRAPQMIVRLPDDVSPDDLA